MIFRTFGVFILIKLGFGVTGTMIAIALGAAVAYLTGIYTCKDNLTENVYSIAARMIAGYAVPVLIGTLGILLMYNMDVILAQHYLPTQSWQYGALKQNSDHNLLFDNKREPGTFPQSSSSTIAWRPST